MMPGSDLAFVSGCAEFDDAAHRSSNHHRKETAIMTLRIFRNLAFAAAALAVVGFVSYTIEHQPLINALAR
jgi:hypothetical protein